MNTFFFMFSRQKHMDTVWNCSDPSINVRIWNPYLLPEQFFFDIFKGAHVLKYIHRWA